MRRAIFLATILLAMSIPYVQADSEEGVLFTWSGDANTVELVGEWDWDSPTTMTEMDGLWSASIELNEGLYFYKFIVDNEYIFDQANTYRGYSDGIENSVAEWKCGSISHQIIEILSLFQALKIPILIAYLQNGNLGVGFDPTADGKHSITLSADGKESSLFSGLVKC